MDQILPWSDGRRLRASHVHFVFSGQSSRAFGAHALGAGGSNEVRTRVMDQRGQRLSTVDPAARLWAPPTSSTVLYFRLPDPQPHQWFGPRSYLPFVLRVTGRIPGDLGGQPQLRGKRGNTEVCVSCRAFHLVPVYFCLRQVPGQVLDNS